MKGPNNNILAIASDNSVDVSKSFETAAITPTEKSLTQAEKDAKFLEAHKAFTRLMKSRKKKHRGKNAGAFGSIGTLRKKKKKLARYLERNTVL